MSGRCRTIVADPPWAYDKFMPSYGEVGEADLRKCIGGRFPRPYLCPCGAFHLGHLASVVVAGRVSREEHHGRG